MTNRTGGRILVDQRQSQGCDGIFTVPGESFLAVLDALHDTPEIDLTVCRQEGGVAYMADADGKMTGRPGVAFVTRGPGATNASAGVHVAFQDSTPMILFIGDVARGDRDREGFQEVDFPAFFGPIAKWAARIGLLGERRDARAVGHVDLVAQHVFGQREHHRAGAAGGREAVGAGDIFRDSPRVLDSRSPFGDWRKEGGEIDLLEALAVAVAARDVADEEDHRGRILEGDVDAGAGVGCARAAGDEGNAGQAGHLPVGVRHVSDPALLSADDRLDLGRVMKRVEHGEETLARYSEDTVAALYLELVNEDSAATA